MTKSSQLSWGSKTALFIKEKENLGRNLLFYLACWPHRAGNYFDITRHLQWLSQPSLSSLRIKQFSSIYLFTLITHLVCQGFLLDIRCIRKDPLMKQMTGSQKGLRFVITHKEFNKETIYKVDRVKENSRDSTDPSPPSPMVRKGLVQFLGLKK